MKIQSRCKIIGASGCLAFIYLWSAGLPEARLVSEFENLLGAGIVDNDCTVLSAKRFFAHFGINADVSKSFTAPADGSKYAARWAYNGFMHYVGMVNGQVVENTLDYSHCVSEGKIDTSDPDNPPYRIIKIQG
jgi:hypothetical protein